MIVLVTAYIFAPPLIRWYVNEKNGHKPVLIRYEHWKQKGKFIYDLTQTVWHGRIMQRALVVNMRYRLESVDKDESKIRQETLPAVKGDVVREVHVSKKADEQQNVRDEYWTNAPSYLIMEKGYKPVERLHDTLLWVRIPVYLQIFDAYKFEVPKDRDEQGKFLFPQHTPGIVDDMFKSQASFRFIRGLNKVAPREMDMHALGMVALLIVGCIGGLWFLGAF